MGGDGTLHEVANGVLDAGVGDARRWATWGRGRAAIFRRTLGIEHRLDAYVEAIASGHTLAVDAGKLRYRDREGKDATRWFVNILSAGMGGLVDRYVSETTKASAARRRTSGRARARSCRASVPACGATCRSEGSSTSAAWTRFMIAICNGRYFGSGMHVAPMARPDDGRFEVVSMDAPGKLAFAAFSRRIYEGKHLIAPGVQHFACDRIAIDLENERARDVFLLDVDGEPLGGLPLEVELVKKALTLRV